MKTDKVIRTRCECDYCGKKNWSVGHMRKHETHCTMNPHRECRMCNRICTDQKPIADLMTLLPDVQSWKDDYDNVIYQDNATELLNGSLPSLRDACENCPACILAAIRQKGIHVGVVTSFDYKEESKSAWNDTHSYSQQYF